MKPETMSDEEVVRVLAERVGIYIESLNALRAEIRDRFKPPFLTSRDALDPVLRGLSDEEWTKLHQLVVELSWRDHSGVKPSDRHRAFFNSKWLITIPPAQLARAIASVIKEGM